MLHAVANQIFSTLNPKGRRSYTRRVDAVLREAERTFWRSYEALDRRRPAIEGEQAWTQAIADTIAEHLGKAIEEALAMRRELVFVADRPGLLEWLLHQFDHRLGLVIQELDERKVRTIILRDLRGEAVPPIVAMIAREELAEDQQPILEPLRRYKVPLGYAATAAAGLVALARMAAVGKG